MTPEPSTAAGQFQLYASCDMKISERIKSLFRRQPATAEELDARAEAESMRQQIREDEEAVRDELGSRVFKY